MDNADNTKIASNEIALMTYALDNAIEDIFATKVDGTMEYANIGKGTTFRFTLSISEGVASPCRKQVILQRYTVDDGASHLVKIVSCNSKFFDALISPSYCT